MEISGIESVMAPRKIIYYFSSHFHEILGGIYFTVKDSLTETEPLSSACPGGWIAWSGKLCKSHLNPV